MCRRAQGLLGNQTPPRAELSHRLFGKPGGDHPIGPLLPVFAMREVYGRFEQKACINHTLELFLAHAKSLNLRQLEVDVGLSCIYAVDIRMRQAMIHGGVWPGESPTGRAPFEKLGNDLIDLIGNPVTRGLRAAEKGYKGEVDLIIDDTPECRKKVVVDDVRERFLEQRNDLRPRRIRKILRV